MPIPADACPELISEDVCCDTFWLVGDRIRSVAFAALLTCIDPTCADREFRSYMTFGRIEDVLGESLIVSMTSPDVAPFSTGRTGIISPAPVTRVVYRLELRENGWPQAKVNGRNVIQAASPDAQHVASKHAYGHAQRVWQALVNGAARRTPGVRLFNPAITPQVLQGGVALSALRPIGPEAYQAAWYMNITVDMTLTNQPSTGGS